MPRLAGRRLLTCGRHPPSSSAASTASRPALRLIGCGVDVIDLEVGHPVRRHSRLAIRRWRNASDVVLAILDMHVTGRIFRIDNQAATQKGQSRNRRRALDPVCSGRPNRACHLPGRFRFRRFCSPAIHRKLRRSDPGRPPSGLHPSRRKRGQSLASKLLRFGGSHVRVVDADSKSSNKEGCPAISHRDAACMRRRLRALKFEFRVVVARAHRIVVRRPNQTESRRRSSQRPGRWCGVRSSRRYQRGAYRC